MASFDGGQLSTEINGLKQKAEMQMMYCSICKITLNSSLQANAHFAGRSHNNKTKELSLESDNPVDIKPTPVTSNPQHFNCIVCQKVFNSTIQLKSHLSGKAHQQLAQSELENPGISTLGTYTPGISSLQTTPAIVKTETSDSEMVEGSTVMHHSANEPAQPVGPPKIVGKNLSDLFQCIMCNITLNSVKQLEQHNNGLRHKIIIGKAKPPAVNGEKWENVRFTKISNAVLGINKDTSTGSGGGMNLREYHCEKCDITVNSQTQLDQHLESNKHKTKGIQPPVSVQNKRKRPAHTSQGQGGGQSHRNNKRQYTRPAPLGNNFTYSNTYIPGGRGEPAPLYRLPPVPKPYHSQNFGFQNWTTDFDGYNNTNLAMF